MRGAARRPAESAAFGRAEGCFQGGSCGPKGRLAGPEARPGQAQTPAKSRPGNSPRCGRFRRNRPQAAPPPA